MSPSVLSRMARRVMVVGLLVGVFGQAAAQQAVSTLAGTGSAGSANGTGTAASFNVSNPSAVAVDAAGNLYVADTGNHVIRKITSAGVVTTYAGTAGASGSADGAGTSVARFNFPRGISIDGTGVLYVANTGNHVIRRIGTDQAVSTIAGSAGNSGSVDGVGAAARFQFPFAIAADRGPSGTGVAVNLFVADTQNHTIRQVVVGSQTVTTLAGTAGAAAFVNSPGNAARFNLPTAIVSNATGSTLAVADRNNHAIRLITVAGATVSTLAGSGVAGQLDSVGTSATFDSPGGIALDASGNVIVADTANHTIRSVTSGGISSTIAGLADNVGNTNGLATSARFNFPTGVAVSGSTIYVVDSNNQLIRVISASQAPSINSQPVATSVAVTGTAQFTVNASGNPPVTYQWMIQPGGIGSFSNITASATYTGVTSPTLTINNVTALMNNDRFQVVVSNGFGSPATSSAATLTVTQMPAFTSAASANFVVGATTQFQITSTGSPTPTYSVSGLPGSGWLSLNPTTGILSGTPSISDANAVITLTATNTAGSVNQTFNANVVTTAPPSIVGPTNQSLTPGFTTATFSVTASGSPSTFTYQWERSTTGTGGVFTPIADGALDGAAYSGTTTANLTITGANANMNGYAYRVVVSNGQSATSSAALLTFPPVITNAPSATFVFSQFGSFTFSATGNPAPVITVTVSGTLPDGITLNGSGTTNPTLSGVPTSTFSSSTFMLVQATSGGVTTTQNFVLNISPQQAPFMTSAPSTTFNVGQPGTFTFTASGAPSPTFQVLGGLPIGVIYNPITGILSGTPQTADGSPFTLTVVAQNSVGTSPAQTFVLTVLGVAPTITLHPVAFAATIGQPATFTAAASGTPLPTLRWQRQSSGTFGFVDLTDDGTYSGTSTSTLTINAVNAGMGLDQYRLRATNGTPPEAFSTGAELRVNVGTVITTIAGQAGFLGAANGIGTSARFNSPSGMAMDGVGNIYIADSANHVIRKMTAGGVVTTLAGVVGFSGSNDGLATEARFNGPQGVAVDGAGNVYVADTANHIIRVVSPIGTVTTRAGTAGAIGNLDGPSTSARFFSPIAIAVDLTGTAYVADSSNHTIRRVTSDGTVTTYAGSPGAAGHVDSFGTSARFNSPSGLAIDAFGSLYVADSVNNVIRKITSGGVVNTIAGFPGSAGFNDGNGTNARFNRPQGIAVDGAGNMYVSDTFSSTIRKVTAAGEVTTLAGLASNPGSTDGSGSAARFNQPIGIAVDFGGNVFVADTRNHTIRRSGTAAPPTFVTQPVSRSAAVGGSVSFTAVATGAPQPGYQWQRAAFSTFGVFQSLTNDGTYSGVNTGTLTVNNVTAAMNNDQFRVVANNGVGPITSEIVTLTLGAAPVFTSAATASFRAGTAGSFRVTVNSDATPTFSASGLPPWATINPATGEITGTPPDTNGSPFSVTVTAANPVTASQVISIVVTPAVIAPTITTQPVSATVDLGQTATFTVAASGTDPITYQWRRDGVSIPGATNASLVLPNVQVGNAGVYSVAVGNSAGAVVSTNATLVVNALPVITGQPRTQVAVVGTSVSFSVTVAGGGNFAYQWRRNGLPIAGANAATLTVSNVSPNDVGNYDVIVSSSLGFVNSSMAQLSLVTTPTAPFITANPATRTVLLGSPVTLTVAAAAAPAPTYQWRKNGVPIAGAVTASFAIGSVQQGDAGAYDVVIANSVGSVTSAVGILNVITRSYAGTYFGLLGSIGEFAMFIREDNTGVFLGYVPSSTAPVMSLNVTVNDSGQFSFSQSAIASTSLASAAGDEPARAAALSPVSVSGSIQADGSISGSMGGGATAQLSGSRSAVTGATQGLTGYYQAGSPANGAVAHTIVGANGTSFVVAQSGAITDGGRGTVTGVGQISLVTGRSVISQSISAGSGTITGSSTGAVTIQTLSGGNDAALASQRLVNISTRTRVGTGDAVAIAGFVISGEESKPVLIRAVGPTLGSAFGVTGFLTSPRLELFRGTSSLAVNTGIGTNRTAIDAAAVQAAAFALGASGTDAAILTTLAPGNYTAVVGSTTNAVGVALIEVYDLSAPTAGQKLLNISTRAAAGTAENTLIAGFVVPPGTAKRVLVRGIGPGLSTFGVTGVLAQPALSIISNASGATIAQNANWSTSPDAAAIVSGSAQVGGFGLVNNDSALIATLPPGNYSAQVLGAGGATGVALIEVYELP